MLTTVTLLINIFIAAIEDLALYEESIAHDL